VTAGVSRVCEKDRVWVLVDVSILNKQDSVNHKSLTLSGWYLERKECSVRPDVEFLCAAVTKLNCRQWKVPELTQLKIITVTQAG